MCLLLYFTPSYYESFIVPSIHNFYFQSIGRTLKLWIELKAMELRLQTARQELLYISDNTGFIPKYTNYEVITWFIRKCSLTV